MGAQRGAVICYLRLVKNLASCSLCSGFLPHGATCCPHCDALLSATGPSRARRLGRAIVNVATGGAIAATLMACYGGAPSNYPPPEPPPGRCDSGTDSDRDGVCTPLDCNDSDATVSPAAADTAGDGIDQNCDGADGTAPVQPQPPG